MTLAVAEVVRSVPDRHMPDRTSPDFDAPPVVEVAIAAYFQPLSGLRSTHLNEIHDLWKADFPGVEEVQPAPPVPEVGAEAKPEIKFEVVNTPVSRYMFTSADGRLLIQVQRDRLVFNWLKIDGGDTYPRFASLLPQFSSAYESFTSFVERSGIGPVRPTQAEVLYVNAIDDVQDVLAPWSGEFNDDFLGRPDSFTADMQFVIKDDAGANRGRLSVTAAPGLNQQTKKPLFILQLVARGEVQPADQAGVVGFAQLGHKWIVNGFVSVTKEAKHKAWEKK